ncbi:MAG: GGDEF domain-containing protein [Acidobacteria bacterium]|nr:GGDEF domain-containing protein [Acidobacteriota bacterium]
MLKKRIRFDPNSGNSADEIKQYDLTAALRILRHAGRENPQLYAKDSGEQIQNVIDALCDLSVHDGMTGLVNATFFHVVLAREIERSLRTGKPCGLMVLDIDHFKRINDTYGHTVGDRAIQSVASNILQNLRSMDTAARIGGEEFAVILPECRPEDAIAAAARIHSALNPLLISIDGHDLRITSSVGVVWTEPDHFQSSGALLSEADREMYRAKRSGRARLCHPPVKSTAITERERCSLMAFMNEENTHDRR